MNPLPRLLGLGLFLVLAALAAVLSGPVWRPPQYPHAPAATTTTNAAPQPALRLAEFSRRAAFPLALTGVALATALLVGLAVRPARGVDSRTPFSAGRAEIGALAKLAESSAAQGAALVHERHGRERAEADASLNQQLLHRALEEKIRLGRDLHDGIIQSLYAAGLTIESARSLAKTDPAEADRRLEQTRQNLNHAIRDLRHYITGLSSDNVRQTTFTEALDALVAEFSAARDVRFDLKIDDAATAQLSPGQSADALQIAREAISNAVRHGAASQMTIRLHPGDGAICLLVQDNGRGFDAAHRARDGAGHGLSNMQARAERLGGSLRLESAPAAGTRIVLTLPLRT
jgi:signal transduction histidine kinase